MAASIHQTHPAQLCRTKISRALKNLLAACTTEQSLHTFLWLAHFTAWCIMQQATSPNTASSKTWHLVLLGNISSNKKNVQCKLEAGNNGTVLVKVWGEGRLGWYHPVPTSENILIVYIPLSLSKHTHHSSLLQQLCFWMPFKFKC